MRSLAPAGRRAIRSKACFGGLAAAAILVGCSSREGEGGAPPSQFRPFAADPVGSRIHFRDQESRHLVTLYPGGRYRFETGNLHTGELVGRRDGVWGWKNQGSHDAELTLDQDVWALKFVSPDSAVAVNQSATGQTFAFQFERL